MKITEARERWQKIVNDTIELRKELMSEIEKHLDGYTAFRFNDLVVPIATAKNSRINCIRRERMKGHIGIAFYVSRPNNVLLPSPYAVDTLDVLTLTNIVEGMQQIDEKREAEQS